MGRKDCLGRPAPGRIRTELRAAFFSLVRGGVFEKALARPKDRLYPRPKTAYRVGRPWTLSHRGLTSFGSVEDFFGERHWKERKARGRSDLGQLHHSRLRRPWCPQPSPPPGCRQGVHQLALIQRRANELGHTEWR